MEPGFEKQFSLPMQAPYVNIILEPNSMFCSCSSTINRQEWIISNKTQAALHSSIFHPNSPSKIGCQQAVPHSGDTHTGSKRRLEDTHTGSERRVEGPTCLTSMNSSLHRPFSKSNCCLRSRETISSQVSIRKFPASFMAVCCWIQWGKFRKKS